MERKELVCSVTCSVRLTNVRLVCSATFFSWWCSEMPEISVYLSPGNLCAGAG